jgi:hypothetical protein
VAQQKFCLYANSCSIRQAKPSDKEWAFIACGDHAIALHVKLSRV